MAFGPQKIIAEVQDMLMRGFMFTAYDMTCSLRNVGEVGEHSEVTNLIKQMFKSGELLDANGIMYERTSIETPGGKAWLYHPQNTTQDEIDFYVAELSWEDEDDDVDSDDIITMIQNIELD